MRIGPKYKIARRLGAPVFEKTQGQKFAVREQRKEVKFKRRPKTDFAVQLLEKQKARYTYAVSEKQFARYVKEALEKKGVRPADSLYRRLELRLDSIALRSGLASTRLAARQMTSHGHLTVNGRKVTIPSYELKPGDVVGVRPGSMSKPLFSEVADNIAKAGTPKWIGVDAKKKEFTITDVPTFEAADLLFDLASVLEFYSR